MPIKRFFSDENLERVKDDFSFLIEMIKELKGELDLAIRDNYFNIYYKGNSLAKVTPKRNDSYHISINSKFINDTKADKRVFFENSESNYQNFLLNKNKVHPFFQKRHINEFNSKIKEIHYGEEIEFEQSLITDNLNRQEFLFIDRQVTDTVLRRKRLDLLALNQVEGNIYQFLVCEVKMGNNPELKGKVASQLTNYVNHISKYFNEYKECYEMHYLQKKGLGLIIKEPSWPQVKIVKPVKGVILVGGYSGLGDDKIRQLNKNFPKLEVQTFKNIVKLDN